jgi:hypothetical protein
MRGSGRTFRPSRRRNHRRHRGRRWGWGGGGGCQRGRSSLKRPEREEKPQKAQRAQKGMGWGRRLPARDRAGDGHRRAGDGVGADVEESPGRYKSDDVGTRHRRVQRCARHRRAGDWRAPPRMGMGTAAHGNGGRTPAVGVGTRHCRARSWLDRLGTALGSGLRYGRARRGRILIRSSTSAAINPTTNVNARTSMVAPFSRRDSMAKFPTHDFRDPGVLATKLARSARVR